MELSSRVLVRRSGQPCGRGHLALAMAVTTLVAPLMLALLGPTAPAAADTIEATVPAGTNPEAVAVNSATDTIYVANQGGNNVTVIDGATNTVTATVPVGTDPGAVAINQATDKIYVVNDDSNDVTVIDGTTNATTTVSVGSSPWRSRSTL